MESVESDLIDEVEVTFNNSDVSKDVVQYSPQPKNEETTNRSTSIIEQAPMHISFVSESKVGEGFMSTHVEYKIHVKTTLPQYKSNDFFCVRRYSDFLWLREQLLENHKGYLIPPLPEKQMFQRFNSELIEYRRRELERFLRRIIDHPDLIQSSFFQTFLEVESSEALVSVTKAKKEPEQKTRFMSMLGSTIEAVSSMALTVQQEPDQWFDAKKNYINALENQLNGLVKATNALIARQSEVGHAYVDLALNSNLLASTEADHSDWIAGSFNKLAFMTTEMSNLQEALVDRETTFVEDSIRDYIRIIGAAKEMLAFRHEKLILYQNATKNLEIRRGKLADSKGSTKLAKEVEEAEKKVDETRGEFNAISEICKKEILRFEETKKVDIKKMLVHLTQANINFGVQVNDLWKKFLDKDVIITPEQSITSSPQK